MEARNYKDKNFSVTLNDRMRGIELRFENKMSEDEIADVKDAGFRWSKRQQLWYAYQNEKAIAFANSLIENAETARESREDPQIQYAKEQSEKENARERTTSLDYKIIGGETKNEITVNELAELVRQRNELDKRISEIQKVVMAGKTVDVSSDQAKELLLATQGVGQNEKEVPNLKTRTYLKEKDVEGIEIVSDEEFNDIVDSIILNDYKNIPNVIRLPNIKAELSKKLGLAENAAFIMKREATHIRPDRKGGYGQALSTEEYRMIPSVMRDATFAVIDKRYQNFQIVFDDSEEKTKINKIVFNKDALGNYVVTIGKVDRRDAFSEMQNEVVGVGVAPTISALRSNEEPPATRLRPSPTTDYSIQEKKNLSTEKTQDLNTLNSPLSVNAECAFERKFRVNNYLDLTGAETVQSAADVAFIFKNLRDEAVENAFAVFVKDKKPTVVHLSIGNSNTAFVPPNIISLAAKKIRPDEMYFVHNHPGGNVEPSEYDLETLEAIKKIVRMNPENERLPVHNIIVNGFSNTYSYIEDKKEFEIEKGRIEDKEFTRDIPIYSADKRVFNKDFECPQNINNPSDVAEYIYSHRLGERKNLNALLLDGTACVGNLCLPYSEIKGNEKKIASDLVTASAQFSANSIVVFGNDYDLFDQVLQLKNTLRESDMDYLLADAIVADGKSNYSSAVEHGLLKVAEPEEKYEAKEKNMSDEMKTLQDLQSRINEQKAKQAELQNKEDSLNSSQEELWQKSFDAFREKVLELKAYIPTKKHSFNNRFDEKNYPIIVSKFENKFEKNGSWDICFNKDGQLVVYKSYDSFDGHSYSFGITDLHFKNSEETKPEKRNLKRVCYEQNLAEKITGIVTEYAQKNLESLEKQNEEKSATLEQKQAYLSKYTAPESNEPMQSVQSLEQFFGREFSSAELVRAIEEMEFYSDEIKSAYSLENDPNAERTYVFGTLAANAIIDIHEEKGMKLNDEAAEEIYKIGIEVAQNKYGSYSELEPKLEKIFGNEKNIRPYSKDMRNLEKALESYYSQQSQTEDGKITGVFTNVWVDNWRIISPLTNENGYPINESTITYKGVESIKCANGEAVCINAKALEAAKLNVGDVLKTVAEANDLRCPQFDIGVYKPSQNYYIDKMNIKEREFYKNPPYPGFAAQMERVKQMAKNHFENGSNEMLKDYRLALVLPKSRHPDDKELSCVMAKNEQTGKYAVWTSFNTDTKGYESTDYGAQGSLNHGHYDIKNLNDAAKIMCAVSDSRPLHIEHRQQIKRGNDVER